MLRRPPDAGAPDEVLDEPSGGRGFRHLTTASEKSFSLAIGHHATLKIYERELKKSTRPKRQK